MKPESKLWHKVKKNTPKIQWTRLESWSSFGTPDLLGYHDNCGFFMVELKIATGKKIHFSPHQKLFHLTRKQRNFILIEEASSSSIKLYESSSILGLLADYREVPSLATDDWTYIERLLIREPLDALRACRLVSLLACGLVGLRARGLVGLLPLEFFPSLRQLLVIFRVSEH